ncbi:CD209 antigen-like protein E [Pecten maximus]|uniref:CD209 antigen-like protein E n=1 Tax=Pecten maximus TaxID=6579 RepID=UPI00145872DF|nr:CD209 antigen-like protein E [Pecten maximus]
MHGCSQATCMENEVCVNKHDGSHVCLVEDICPTMEWMSFNHKCYLFHDEKMTANENLKLCETFNATMVRVDDDAVSEFLNSEMKKRENIGIWIAANDRDVEGEWVWGPGDIITNEAWHIGEPSGNHLSDEDCVTFWPSWRDMRCSETHTAFSVCEHPNMISP